MTPEVVKPIDKFTGVEERKQANGIPNVLTP